MHDDFVTRGKRVYGILLLFWKCKIKKKDTKRNVITSFATNAEISTSAEE